MLPPESAIDILPWLGKVRALAFSALMPCGVLESDLDGRDPYYWQMILWDPIQDSVIGGQRLLFVGEDQLMSGEAIDDCVSYLEHCYPGFAQTVLSAHHAFAEVGRTFVSPAYQGGVWLKELIRGFVRLPESRGIRRAFGLISFNHLATSKEATDVFLSALSRSLFRGDTLIPTPRYPYYPSDTPANLFWDAFELTPLEIAIKNLDPSFSLPPVLRPYRSLCSVEYEGASLATSYNQVMQLLFSGKSELISRQQRRRLPAYPSF